MLLWAIYIPNQRNPSPLMKEDGMSNAIIVEQERAGSV